MQIFPSAPDFIAQPAEQRPLKAKVAGSLPAEVTTSRSSVDRIAPCEGVDVGATPAEMTRAFSDNGSMPSLHLEGGSSILPRSTTRITALNFSNWATQGKVFR